MISKKRYKKRLTKFGKVFFCIFVLLSISSTILFFGLLKDNFYEKKETDTYLIEINYPNLKNKNLMNYSNNYIQDKEKQFKNIINNMNGDSSTKFELRSYYEINETEDILGVHLKFYEYTGGNHYIGDDKSYYYSKQDGKVFSIKDFLENDNSLDKLANISYYYVMKYSNDNKLNFDEEFVKEGLKSDSKNFEHFNFKDDGLEIIFPPLQVAYSAAGEVKILIPYSELNDIIKDKYLKYTDDNNVSYTRRNLENFKGKKLIAFTFDDGPSYVGTNKLLNNLDKFDARVTFFVLGSRVNDYKDTLKKAYKMGNLIGSHTYSHSDLLTLDDYSITDEIKRTNELIRNVTGRETMYLRPPYGNINSKIKYLSNMYTILWDLDTEDWKYEDSERIANYIINNAHDGAIVLLHDLYETSIDGALLAMDRLQDEGYAFVTIDEMVNIKNIKLDKDKSYFQM